MFHNVKFVVHLASFYLFWEPHLCSETPVLKMLGVLAIWVSVFNG